VNHVTKAVIPAAGVGSRFLPLTKSMPKEMLPVVHMPVIQYVVKQAWEAGIREILVITGRGKRSIEDYLDRSYEGGQNPYLESLDRMLDDLAIFFVRQHEVRGLGDAIGHAESFVDDEPFAVLLGDTITIPSCTKELVDLFSLHHRPVIAVEEVPPSLVGMYGIVSCTRSHDGQLFVRDLVEKPPIHESPSNLAILGSYLFTPEIFESIRRTSPGKDGEIQLTDAMRILNKENPISVHIYRGRRFDIGNKLDWLKANIELALADEDLGPDIRKFIKELSNE
jgi:UTP--glucose-1-phosphate uridylyltransferase